MAKVPAVVTLTGDHDGSRRSKTGDGRAGHAWAIDARQRSEHLRSLLPTSQFCHPIIFSVKNHIFLHLLIAAIAKLVTNNEVKTRHLTSTGLPGNRLRR
jgi:hypothetical protein